MRLLHKLLCLLGVHAWMAGGWNTSWPNPKVSDKRPSRDKYFLCSICNKKSHIHQELPVGKDKFPQELHWDLRLLFAWYDLWVGIYIHYESLDKMIIYFLPIPCCGLKLTVYRY